MNNANTDKLDMPSVKQGVDTLWAIVENLVSANTSVEQSARERLEDAETIRAINAYAAARNQVLTDKVYRGVIRRFPAMRDYIAKQSEPDSVIPTLQNYPAYGNALRFVDGFAKIVKGVSPVFSEGQEGQVTVTAVSTAVYNAVDKIAPLSEIVQEIAGLERDFYLKTAEGINGLARSKDMKPEDIVKIQEYMDELTKYVFPKREDAEKYHSSIEEQERKAITAVSGALEYVIKTFIPKIVNTSAMTKGLPTLKAYDALTTALGEFRAQEFDRIYGKNSEPIVAEVNS